MKKADILHIRVSERTKGMLKDMAEKEHRSMTSMVEVLIKEAALKSRNEKCAKIREECFKKIEEIENSKPAKSWDEAYGAVANKKIYEDRIALCDMLEKITDEEAERLSSIPYYSNNKMAVKDIKEKYEMSWSDIEALRRMLW